MARKWQDVHTALAEAVLGTAEGPPASDDYLGQLLVALFIEGEAMARGMNPRDVTADIAEPWVSAIGSLEATTAKHAYIEKALRFAVSGDFARAGRFIRDGMIDGASHIAAARAVARNEDKREAKRRAIAAGRASGIKESLGERDEKIRRDAAALRAAGRSEREIAGVLAQKAYGGRRLSARQIRAILGPRQEKRK